MPPALLSALSSEDELQEEASWLSDMIQCWLNEEWAAQELLEVHAQLGDATGQVRPRTWGPCGCCSVVRQQCRQGVHCTLVPLSGTPAVLPAPPICLAPLTGPATAACKQAYARLRRQEGVSEMGDLVLGLATELMTSFDFMPTCAAQREGGNSAQACQGCRCCRCCGWVAAAAAVAASAVAGVVLLLPSCSQQMAHGWLGWAYAHCAPQSPCLAGSPRRLT